MLFRSYAATDERNICADGWEVPSATELDTLFTYLGGGATASNKLREVGTTYWTSPNTGATNEVGFNSRASGIRIHDGSFVDLIGNMHLWSSTAYDATTARGRQITPSGINLTAFGKTRGQSLRPRKTTTTLTHGQTGTYTGNDGKVYRTICIGTQEWLADNLCETKYRNGDTIPEVTNNAAWAALSTGALCAYNNDWSNVLI